MNSLGKLAIAMCASASLHVLPAGVHAQTPASDTAGKQDGRGMPRQATGSFEVIRKPLSPTVQIADNAFGRLAIDKQYAGDFVGNGNGEMLTAMTSTKGSAAYVAIERVAGTLHGKKGSFVLQHAGIMNRGADQLSLVIVPDSGAEELKGIAGTCAIKVVDSKHFYVLEYSLPE